MNRLSQWLGLLLCVLAARPAALCGQVKSDPPEVKSRLRHIKARLYEARHSPRARRALREEAVAHLGAGSRAFVETHGEEAVDAISVCSKSVALRLVEFHDCGELGRLPRPADLLRVIGQHDGDDVAVWAIQHARELMELDSFDAFLLDPLEYALGLKKLADGAAQARARRLSSQAKVVTPMPQTLSFAMPVDWRPIAGVVGAGAFIGLLVWWKRQRAGAGQGLRDRLK